MERDPLANAHYRLDEAMQVLKQKQSSDTQLRELLFLQIRETSKAVEDAGKSGITHLQFLALHAKYVLFKELRKKYIPLK